MSILQNDRVLLQPLSAADAAAFYRLYQEEFSAETAEGFTQRIMASCVHIWSVRLPEEPGSIIGDCALHHYSADQGSIEIGGSLLLGFQGRSIMKNAFLLVIDFALSNYRLKQIAGRTTPDNNAAIGLLKSLGFRFYTAHQGESVFIKSFVSEAPR